MKEHDINIRFIEISSNFVGQRIDNFLCVYFKKVPKSVIYRIIRIGAVRVNKKRIKFQYKLKIGDFLKIPVIKQIKKNVLNIRCFEEIKFLQDAIIYEDDQLLILNKPSGIAVHGGSGLNFGVIEGLRALRPKMQFLELVHRLDRATSGVLLVAKKRASLVYLHEQLRLQKIKKRYLALVHGRWNLNTKIISTILFKNDIASRINNTEIISENLYRGKLATTHFCIKENFNNIATLLLITPKTGRTHQIRIHTNYENHPIIGDEIYGNYASNAVFKKYGLDRLFLHADSLSFYHPHTKKLFYTRAPIDQSLSNCLCYLRNLISTNNNDFK